MRERGEGGCTTYMSVLRCGVRDFSPFENEEY